MHRLSGAVLALLLIAVPATAQDTEYTVRIGAGDIPTTPANEESGHWHVRQVLPFTHGNATDVALFIPSGTAIVQASCTCNVSETRMNDRVAWSLDDSTAAGSYHVELWSRVQAREVFATQWRMPEGTEDGLVIAFTPDGFTLEAPVQGSSPGLTTDGTRRITTFEATGDLFWIAAHQAQASGPVVPEPDGFDFVALAIGLALGIVLWYVLVQQGIVQKRGRKQVAAVPAHTVAASEGKATLEARKRVLMAALKDLEVAKMNREVENDSYDIVKAELKKQAVTVMRALEEAS